MLPDGEFAGSFCFFDSGGSFFGQLTVFALCGFAAADMAFLLVFLKYRFYLFVESFIRLFEFYRYVLMDGAFTYPELLCGGSYSRVVFNNVFSEYDTSFLTTVAALFQR